jgi:adenosine kinase
MTILVSGSLAFDRLATFPGLFADNILKDKLSILNASFVVDSVTRVHGGTAGNIAYNLYLLGEKPLVISSVGEDPDGADYLVRLKEWALSTEAVRVDQKLPTAGAYIATDSSSNQIIFFHPGAITSGSGFSPKSLPKDPGGRHLAMVSPGGEADMLRLPSEYRSLGIPFILDPGQQTPVFTGKELLSMLEGALMLITNEYELDLLLGRCSLKASDLFKYTETVLTTMGAKGSRILTREKETFIEAVPVKVSVNPTGAGDAYRAGLLKGLTAGLGLEGACRLGASVAAFCVEAPGTQGHSFTVGDIVSRHRGAFGTEPAI